MLVSLVASIPSPSQNEISIGPLDLRAYGFLIALGVLAGVWLASRRVAQDGLDPEIIPNMALWALPAAIVGARIYFVLTNWGRFSDDLPAAFRLWEGGLGIPGGVLLGMVVGVWWLRRNDVPLAPVFTAAALGLPLGQIIGRFGNWFNQELYGRPTTLPWGLEIDAEHRIRGYEDPDLLFHPTFAYEILWNIALLGFLLWIDRKRILRPGALFAVYLIGYGIGRILIELLRIDPVDELFGVRYHIWAMVAFIVAAAIYLQRYGLRRDATDIDPDELADDDEAPSKPQAPLRRPRRGGGTATKTRPERSTKTTGAKAKVAATDDVAEGGDEADDDQQGETEKDRVVEKAGTAAATTAKRGKGRATKKTQPIIAADDDAETTADTEEVDRPDADEPTKTAKGKTAKGKAAKGKGKADADEPTKAAKGKGEGKAKAGGDEPTKAAKGKAAKGKAKAGADEPDADEAPDGSSTDDDAVARALSMAEDVRAKSTDDDSTPS